MENTISGFILEETKIKDLLFFRACHDNGNSLVKKVGDKS